MQRPTGGKDGDFAHLRWIFDADEPAMTFGLNIKTPKLRYINRRELATPDWIQDHEKVMLFSTARFPLMLMNKRQRVQAARWLIVIRRYFLFGESCSEIRKELHISTAAVKNIVRHIRHAFAGTRLDGKPRTGRPVGRRKQPPKAA